LVARLLWEQDVAGSNPAAPTNKNKELRLKGISFFFVCGGDLFRI
jgi:hypothetical protein